MSGEVRLKLDIGGPATLDIFNARQGSRWNLPCRFTEVPDDIDLATVTGAVAKLFENEKSTVAKATLQVDISTLASASAFRIWAAKATTAAVTEGAYLWEVQFLASSVELDGYAPLAGRWEVRRRLVAA